MEDNALMEIVFTNIQLKPQVSFRVAAEKKLPQRHRNTEKMFLANGH
jgi:hypothetical protein